jgi:hypothetical protein
MQELSARQDLEDARGELHDVLEDYGPSLPARLRAKVRRALALLDSATAKLDGAEHAGAWPRSLRAGDEGRSPVVPSRA